MIGFHIGFVISFPNGLHIGYTIVYLRVFTSSKRRSIALGMNLFNEVRTRVISVKYLPPLLISFFTHYPCITRYFAIPSALCLLHLHFVYHIYIIGLPIGFLNGFLHVLRVPMTLSLCT